MVYGLWSMVHGQFRKALRFATDLTHGVIGLSALSRLPIITNIVIVSTIHGLWTMVHGLYRKALRYATDLTQ